MLYIGNFQNNVKDSLIYEISFDGVLDILHSTSMHMHRRPFISFRILNPGTRFLRNDAILTTFIF